MKMRTKFFQILAVVPVFLTCSTLSNASYTFNGKELDKLFEEPVGEIVAFSASDSDTASITFTNKGLSVMWGKLSIDAEEKNALGDSKLESGSGIMLISNVQFSGEFSDEAGFLGASTFDTLKMSAQKFSFFQTSVAFKNIAKFCALESSPSMVREVAFTKREGTNYPLIMGKIDFTRKDDNFSGAEGFPFLLISGIKELILTLDKRKI